MKTKKIASMLLLVASITWGCAQSSSEEQESSGDQVPKKEQVEAPKQQVQAPKTQGAPAAGEVDQFGRKPGEAHYGHNHASPDPNAAANPTSAQPQQAPKAGEPDKYGRKPGDEHYGHNHE